MTARGIRAAAVAAVVAVVAAAASGCGGGTSHATIGVHFSHFTTVDVTAHAGEPITITLRNDDPIEHEWIVGTAEVHERHRTGTEPFHGTIPTEVTLAPLSSHVTTVKFDQPGDYQYICHLPGHEQYGMVGTLHVVA